MRYLEQVTLPSRGKAETLLERLINNCTCYPDRYPFGVFNHWEDEVLPMEPLTILYGGNGSGKTTLLNCIAQKLGLDRHSLHNGGHFLAAYADLLQCRLSGKPWEEGAVLTSDDVFDDLLDQRSLNQGIDLARDEVLQEYKVLRDSDFQLKSLDDYDQLKKVVLAKRRKGSGSDYVRRTLGGEVETRSNGETALHYFTNHIKDDGLYLLDEPENSLSAEFQQELARFLSDSVRFFGCQVILSTHSPFLLAMPGALVYDLDQRPIQAVPWTQLPAVRAYYEFFRKHAGDFS